MVTAMVARVGPHSDVADLAKHSSVPVINALSDMYHPLQSIADFATIVEALPSAPEPSRSPSPGLGLEGLKIAWVGDANNVLFDLAIGARKLGIDIAVATPKGYEIPLEMREIIQLAGQGVPHAGQVTETTVPEEAVKGADVLVTDTWVSMGQEEEKGKRLRDFDGFQVTSDLAARGGAKKHWKFMHCLPRHSEEVSDDVFYSPRSLVFIEGENRLWAAIVNTGLPKSKSSSHLVRPKTSRKGGEPAEWLLRAGAAISAEARESKGQSWLVSRASSTSLVDHVESRESFSFADDEFSPVSTRDSRFSLSRPASAMTSRVASRRGSRVGSRADFMLTPLGSRTPRRGLAADVDGNIDDTGSYFDDEVIAEPDFVDADEELYNEEADDDLELSRLTRKRGLGLGGWIDRFVGWSLFAGDVVEDEEDEEEMDETRLDGGHVHESGIYDATPAASPPLPPHNSLSGTAQDEKGARQISPNDHPLQEDESAGDGERDGGKVGGGEGEGEGGWRDAAYLLSLASKILL
ncbi:MAG: ornithine carbamoyltransferase [Thelocarpon superellum]|nr:MAG: ornithine carbamoyltransferase [Thelocarpon superellum]